MNHVYRVVWSDALKIWAVVSEGGRGRGKSSRSEVASPPRKGRSARPQRALWGLAFATLATGAAADCVTTGSSISCAPGATQTTLVGNGAATSNVTLDVLPNALIDNPTGTAISLGDNTTITLHSGATVRNTAPATGNGPYGTGPNTIEFRDNNTLVIAQGASVLSDGTSGIAEAINTLGTGNTILNNGRISAPQAAAIWLESGTGHTTIVNGATGVIEAAGGAGAIVGAGGTMTVDFTNQGVLNGSLNFANGDDTLRVYTGSTLSGAINGGGGVNTLYLSGAGTDSFVQTITNFQSLVKDGAGTWTLATVMPQLDRTQVASGTLILGVDASGFTGSTQVDAAGVLQSTPAFAPLAITDNGLVRFTEVGTATYGGLLTGSGGLEASGPGTVVLTQDQAFTGTTTITAGELRLGNGGTAGNVLGPIVDNGRLTIDRSDTVRFALPITGSGALQQAGAGTTLLTADNTYAGGTTVSAGTLQLGDGGTTGSLVGDVRNDARLVIDRAGALTLAGVISGTGALDQVGSGTTTLTGANSYSGPTTVAAGTLAAGAANTLSAASAHTVLTGATLQLGGFNQTVAALDNAGTVSLVGTAPGTTLTVTGAYVGRGGVLALGTRLDAVGPSDRLVLDGAAASATGLTRIAITQLGGLGAQTAGNGIEVVSARNGAVTAGDAFALDGGHVDAGAFEYRLHAGDTAGAGANWYLRADALPTPPVPPAGPDAGGGGAPTTPTPPPPPAYRAEVPLYAALPSLVRQGDMAMLSNLHRRMGDEASAGTDGDGTQRAWGRVFGGTTRIAQQGTSATVDRARMEGVQAGVDLYADPAWKAGLYAGVLHTDGRVFGQYGLLGTGGLSDAGSVRSNSRYLGGYATYADRDGFYADLVLQYGDHDLSVSPRPQRSVSSDGHSLTASAEAGQRFAIDADWALEPQVQLIYNRLRLEDAAISGATVQNDADRALTARIGLRLVGDLATTAGRLKPYARLNLWHGFSGTDTASFVSAAATTPIRSRTGYTSIESALGLTLEVTPTVSVYGEVGKLFDTGHGSARVSSASVQGSAGMKLRF